MILPPQPWAAGEGARAIMAALDVAGGASKVVGGAVRDGLLGLPVNDVDFATRFEPREAMRRLQAGGVKAVPTGIAHGTITAVTPDIKIEVTTLRRDIATDGRHATVAFTDDWRADASRRDFTINALYADPLTRAVEDFFGGVEDLAVRRVRFIGVALERIAEDHLRILRFFRFHARFGNGPPDPDGLAACVARANDLMALSRERVRDEVLKLLLVADPVPTLGVMLDGGILVPVLPEIAGLDRLAALIAAERAAGVAGGAERRLSALLPPDPAVLDAVGTRLRLSNAERRRLVLTAAPAPDLRAAAYRDGTDSAVDRALLAGRDPGVVIGWPRPRLPVSGRHLIERGMAAGPGVARALAQVESAWIAAGFPQDVGPLLDRAVSDAAQGAA